MKSKHIVITIPAYNEENDLGRVIDDIKKVMNEKYTYQKNDDIKKVMNERDTYEILLVDDGSEDNTANIAEKQGVTVYLNNRNLRLAKTFQHEMQQCLNLEPEPNIIIHTDADGQYPAHYIPLMIKKIEEGNDLVLGSRFKKGKYRGSLMKRLGNIAFAYVFSGLLKTKITDTTTGFRAFTPEVARLPLINDFTYTQEQLIMASRAKMLITEIPIISNKTRKSKLFVHSVDYAIKAWINILRIYRDFEPLKFFGIIGLSFFSLGFILGLWVVYLWLTTGSVGALPRVILSMLLIVTGIQIGLFGFLADMNKK